MDSNLTNLAYVEEVTLGTTPSANLQVLRRTGGSINPDQPTVVSEEIRSDLRAGKPVRTGQMAGGSVNVEWSHTTLDDILEGMLMSAWSSDVLVDGTTKKHYTFEQQFVDPAISPSQYMIFRGSRIGSLSLNLALQSIVTGSFGVMATTPSIAQASAGTGNTAATTTDAFNTVDMVTSLLEGQASTTLASLGRVTGVTIQLDRSLRQKMEIGTLNPWDIGVGRLLVTGEIQQYFEDDTLMDAYFAFQDRALDITLNDGTNSIQIEIPKLKLTGQPVIDVPGPDSDCIARYPFTAYADVGDAALVRFTRS